MNNLSEAVQLLEQGGVITRLKSEAQDAKEVERAELLARLALFEQDEAKRVATREKVRPVLLEKIAELEAELKAARHELAALEGFTPPTGDKLRGKLRKLSDARIAEAISQLHDLSSKACRAFVSGQKRVKLLTGGYSTQTVSNALEISDLVARIRGIVRELEALQEAKRPDDLPAYLAAKIEPIKLQVQKLHGLN